jgi:SAM-dependent methyltransferase
LASFILTAIGSRVYKWDVNESHITFLSSPEWARMLETDLVPWVEAAGELGDDVLEIGPGPGLTTDLLASRVVRLTAIEADPQLAASLTQRLRGGNVEVIHRDATRSGLDSDRFSTVTCFSVLHHLPSPAAQDRLFAEIGRVLRPGGMFVGADSLDSEPIRAGHAGDTFVPVDPDALRTRLTPAGLVLSDLDRGDYQFRFVAKKPGL